MSAPSFAKQLASFSISAAALLLAACGGGLDSATADAMTLEQAQASSRTFTVNGTVFSSSPCAREGGVCAFSGTRLVAFGAKSSFVVKSLSGPVSCNLTTFGDPLVGVAKKCYLAIETTAVAPPPEPTPAPAPVDQSLTLSWAAPTINSDGSPLTDLVGFQIYYGSAPGAYSTTVAVASPSTLTYRFDNLPSGTYFAIVKGINSAGIESDASTELSKTIQ